MITGSTQVFAILGDPVAHSLSPAMQNAAFSALGLPAAYVPLRCRDTDIPPLIHALAHAGGGGNVTVPHKAAAARAVSRRSALAERVGAVNTFWGEDGAVVGDNTDVPGLLDALRPLAPPAGPWLIIGTGGAARAAAVAAAEHGAGVAVASRDESRARDFGPWAASRGIGSAAVADCRVVINATPVGLHPDDPLPAVREVAPRAEVALDLVYARGETRWVRAARAAGLRSADGRGMLVAQGAAALERWFPRTRAPTELMRAVVDAALR